MYYIIYETLNMINNKKYIGKHAQSNDFSPYEFDGYLGSGTLISRSINKYGKKAFIRKTLFVLDTYEEMTSKEKEIITLDMILSDEYYNIRLGGDGGDTTFYLNEEEKAARYKKAVQTKMKNGTLTDSDEVKEIKSKSSKKRVIAKPWTIPNNKGRIHGGQALKNLKKSHEKRKGVYIWINNSVEDKLHDKRNGDIPNGWSKGRIISPMKNKFHTEAAKDKIRVAAGEFICYNNGSKNLKLKEGELPPDGFVLGMIQKKRKKCWITNGVETKFCYDSTIPDGWYKGRTL